MKYQINFQEWIDWARDMLSMSRFASDLEVLQTGYKYLGIPKAVVVFYEEKSGLVNYQRRVSEVISTWKR